jgi:uncharacterized protein YaaN involved in tellurite resistance
MSTVWIGKLVVRWQAGGRDAVEKKTTHPKSRARIACSRSTRIMREFSRTVCVSLHSRTLAGKNQRRTAILGGSTVSENAATAAAPAHEPEKLAAPEPLVAPAAVATVAPETGNTMVDVKPDRLPALDKVVSTYVEQIIALDTDSDDFARKADDVRTMGDKEIRDASNVSNRLLQKSINEMDANGAKGDIPRTLLDLRRQIEMLDPKQATIGKKLLGLIPYGDALQDYFRKYESSQKHLDVIITALLDGKDELERDNADLEQEKRNLWAAIGKLREFAYIAERMDAELTAKIADLKVTDPEKARKLENDVLFYVRQKRQDLLTQQAVSIQGYLAIDLIRKNNIELMKGVDRATTTTISALRTAVIVSQALATQKIVLDQISALNDTTNAMIVGTSELLKEQSATIQKQAASSTIDLDKLQVAFANVYEAMDSIDTFKQEALVSMQTTVNGLQVEIDKSQQYLDRAAPTDTKQSGTSGVSLPT